MRRLMSVAAFAAALTMTAPVWAQTSEQLNQQELSTITPGTAPAPVGQPGAPAYTGAPAYAGAPAPAYPYPYPYPQPYPYPYPYPYDPYAYYGAPAGVWVGGGCCWGGGGHDGGWGGGGRGGGHR
jgi:hypothetical protein